MAGPLTGTRVIELGGRGAAPFGGMILADLGAEVVRLARPEPGAGPGATGTERMISGRRRVDPVLRGRRTVTADLKDPAGLAAARDLIDTADVLVEAYRPGVAERLGLGPDDCAARNPRLVYARITGWGQEGPLKDVPGHDINYVALTGVLDLLRRAPGDAPAPPLNLLGDYGGGGMLLVTGILAALVERSVSGKGQVIDVAMTDGVSLLASVVHGMRAEGLWGPPGGNVLDLGAPFYNVYETADGRHVTVGCGEPKFYANLLTLAGLPDDERSALLEGQAKPETWPAGKASLQRVFKTRTQRQWRDLLEGTDTCFAPVLTLDEAAVHPHNTARGTHVRVDGVIQPAPAPRFSRSVTGPPAGQSAGQSATTGIPPSVTEETRAFWDAAAEGRLVVERCAACGAHGFPPRGICRSCRSRDTGPHEVTGRGTVYSYTVNYQRWLPDLEVPYAVVLVEFPSCPGVRVAGRLRGIGPEQVTVGLPVDIGFEPGPGGFAIPSFAAAGS